MNKLSFIMTMVLVLLFCCTTGCSGQNTPGAPNRTGANASGKAMWFWDPWLQMNALKLDTPAGWKAACDIVWDFNNSAIPCRFWLKAANNDESKGLEIFPGENFNCTPQPFQMFGRGNVYLGQTLMEPYTATNFLRQIVIPKFRSSVKQLKEISAQQLPDMIQQTSAQAQAPADAACVIISYINHKGVEIKESFICTIAYYNINNYCGWVPQAVISIKVPKSAHEDADEKEIGFILSTMAFNPDWTSAHLKIRNAITQNAQQTIINTSEAARRYAQQGARAREAQSSVINDRLKTSSDIHEKWTDVLTGQERFVDPSGNEHVETTYRAEGWINGLGETVYAPGNSTYNPNYDPSLSGNWDRMRVK